MCMARSFHEALRHHLDKSCTGNKALATGIVEIGHGLGGNDVLKLPAFLDLRLDRSWRRGVWQHRCGGYGGVAARRLLPLPTLTMAGPGNTPCHPAPARNQWRARNGKRKKFLITPPSAITVMKMLLPAIRARDHDNPQERGWKAAACSIQLQAITARTMANARRRH